MAWLLLIVLFNQIHDSYFLDTGFDIKLFTTYITAAFASMLFVSTCFCHLSRFTITYIIFLFLHFAVNFFLKFQNSVCLQLSRKFNVIAELQKRDEI